MSFVSYVLFEPVNYGDFERTETVLCVLRCVLLSFQGKHFYKICFCKRILFEEILFSAFRLKGFLERVVHFPFCVWVP